MKKTIVAILIVFKLASAQTSTSYQICFWSVLTLAGAGTIHIVSGIVSKLSSPKKTETEIFELQSHIKTTPDSLWLTEYWSYNLLEVKEAKKILKETEKHLDFRIIRKEIKTSNVR